MSTYTLQRTRPLALGLLDTITVSLTVLVVVGMASNIARSIVSISGAKQVRRKRTSWTWPWRRRLDLEDVNATAPTPGAPTLQSRREKLRAVWLSNYAVHSSATTGGCFWERAQSSRG